jgi:hypothetical protein
MKLLLTSCLFIKNKLVGWIVNEIAVGEVGVWYTEN